MEVIPWGSGAVLLISVALLGYFRLKALHRIERKLDGLSYHTPYGEKKGVAKHARNNGESKRNES